MNALQIINSIRDLSTEQPNLTSWPLLPPPAPLPMATSDTVAWSPDLAEENSELEALKAQIARVEGELEQAIEAGDTATVQQKGDELQALLAQLAAFMNSSATPSFGDAGGAPSGGGAVAPVGGSSDGGSFGPAATATAPAPVGETMPNGSGSDAVELARQYLGHNAIDIKGRMPNFTAAGGQTNNCADFVSSALESTGRLQGHHISVRELEQSLIQQGYRAVPASQARPGDVWISNSRGHTELVSTRGATHTIGSNNDRPGHQVISERPKAAGTGVVYQKVG